MKKDYKLITGNKRRTTNDFNLGYIMIALSLALILIASIYIYNMNSSRLIRNLKENNYICNKIECSKIEDNNLTIINIEDITLNKSTDLYIIKIKNNEIVYENRMTKELCSYTKDNFDKTKLIDMGYRYTSYCQEYIPKINEVIKEYNTILESSKIKLQK